MYRGGSVTEESKNKYISAVVLADQEQAMTEEKVAVSSKVKVLQVIVLITYRKKCLPS